MQTVSEKFNTAPLSFEQIQTAMDRIQRIYLLDRPPRFDNERRDEDRFGVTIPVEIRPLDHNLQPLAFSYPGITRDMSATGLSAVTTDPEAHQHVVVTVKPYQLDAFSIVASIIYCNDHDWYYRTGLKFVAPQQLTRT